MTGSKTKRLINAISERLISFTSVAVVCCVSVPNAITANDQLISRALFNGSNWVNQSNEILPDTQFRKVDMGFGIWLSSTTEANIAARSKPYLSANSEITAIEKGENIFFSLAFTNPIIKADRSTSITCKVLMLNPEKNIMLKQNVDDCARGKLLGDKTNIYKSAMDVKYSGDNNSIEGVHEIKIEVTDNLSRRSAVVSLTWEVHSDWI